jgi:LPS-assembly protein
MTTLKNKWPIVTGNPLRSAACTFALITLFIILCASPCIAAEKTTDDKTVITSETLEYDQDSNTYIAKGKAKVQRDNAMIEADELRYHDKTSDTTALGNVRYQDPDVMITANKAELNLETKTGKLYDANILYKKDNYHFSGREIEKRQKGYYFSPDALFTTCDAPVPAWCFKGKNVDVLTGNSMTADNTTFRILNLPVLYTPYFQAPLSDRKSGLLIPVIGYGKQKGAHINIPYFLVLSENRDATLVLDEYTKRGLGEGLEYRYVEVGDMKGKWWVYHISDRELNKNFVEVRGVHEQRPADGINGFLNINYVNEKDFYREYSPYRDLRYNRFLESTGEISLPLANSRAYLLSQYWLDLKQDTKTVSQRLPEAGYVLNPTNLGKFWFSGTTAFSNFWNKDGVDGQRIDIFPRVLHSFGDDITMSQSLGLRETAYSLHRNGDDSPHREVLAYEITGHTSFFRKYDSFTHVVEPSLSYALISDSENNLPNFDSTELFKRTSRVELSLLNRFYNKDGEIMVIRASQGYEAYHEDRTSLPLRVEVGIKKPLFLRFGATCDANTGKLETANSDVSVKISDTVLSAGQRYNAQDDTSFINAGVNLHPFKPLYIESKLWYDAKTKKTKDIVFDIKYLKQCWGITIELTKKPGDFNAVFMLELKGLTKGFKS